MRTHTYRGWTIEPAYIGWWGTHPNHDPEPGCDDRCVHGMTIAEVHGEIDDKIGDEPERCAVPMTTTGFLREIVSIFERAV